MRLLLAGVVLLAACGQGGTVTPIVASPSPSLTQPPAPAHCTARGMLPDPVCTPGAANPAVTQATIGATICAKGWATKQRPPVTWSEPLKGRMAKAYGFYAGKSLTSYQFDHRVPLEVGGAPMSVANLWPERLADAAVKDKVEASVHARVCSGKITLAAGQAIFLTGAWV